MNSRKSTLFFITLLMFILSVTQIVQGQARLLGEVDFPNSGSIEAQRDLIEGLLFMHNFEYRDATISFRNAQKIDPGFAMAYWGEAMTKNQPIWHRQQRDEAIEILNKLAPTPEERREMAGTEREEMYLYTLEVLYGTLPETENLSKEERDFRYRDALKELLEAYPDDDEARSFYGLSILGTAHEGRDFRIYMQAAAELMPVWERNKKHPGAAHYLIHSFDDSIHAPLGLPMAEAYAEIAPDAAHAQHMVSHIFLELGRWDDVINANAVARRVQQERQIELNENISVCGHYTWWLQYGYLQKGDAVEAQKILQTCKERIDEGNPGGNLFGELWHFGVMMSHQIIDTENWQSVSEWRHEFSTESPAGKNYYFTSALASLKNGDPEEAEEFLKDLKRIKVSNVNNEDRERDIQVIQIESLLLLESGKNDEALNLLEKAALMESGLPVNFGPPTIVKPSFELLGDQHLKLGNYKESIEYYEKQLVRTPERKRSLEGKKLAMESTIE